MSDEIKLKSDYFICNQYKKSVDTMKKKQEISIIIADLSEKARQIFIDKVKLSFMVNKYSIKCPNCDNVKLRILCYDDKYYGKCDNCVSIFDLKTNEIIDDPFNSLIL